MLRDDAPVTLLAFTRTGTESQVVILSRYEELRWALRSPELIASRWANMMGQKRPLIPLDIDPPEHAPYRRLLDPLFSPRAVLTLEEKTRELAGRLIAGFADRGSCDFHAEFSVPFPCTVFLELVGFPREGLEQMLAWNRALVHVEDVVPSGDPAEVARVLSDTAALSGQSKIGTSFGPDNHA